MTKARYGRITPGSKCLASEYKVGCWADVLHHLDRRCSGRRHCAISIPDNTMHLLQPCQKDLFAYLEADYVCQKGYYTFFRAEPLDAYCCCCFCNFWRPGTLTLSPERQGAWTSKITNDGLTVSGTGCCIAVPIWQQWASKGYIELLNCMPGSPLLQLLTARPRVVPVSGADNLSAGDSIIRIVPFEYVWLLLISKNEKS